MQPSIAERIAFGRPYDPVADDTVVVPRSGTALVGRILISAIFLVSGFAKLTDPASTVGYMESADVGGADVLVYVAGIAEVLGGLSLLFGFLTRIGAMGLIVLLAIINVMMHDFWAMPEPEAKAQMAQFVKNLAIMGGLFMVVAMGPGRYSLDARMRRPKSV
jgi:putative oxidoreductase